MPTRRLDKELESVFSQRAAPIGRDESSWRAERDYDLGEYWQRRIASATRPLSSAQVEELLSYAELETALATLGDAAGLGLLSQAHCEAVLRRADIDLYPKAAWAKHEIRLRLDVNTFLAEQDVLKRRPILAELLHQKRLWPLYDLLHNLSAEELKYCEASLADRSVLTRHGREKARQVIRARQTRMRDEGRALQ
jgi:hypothetical protein